LCISLRSVLFDCSGFPVGGSDWHIRGGNQKSISNEREDEGEKHSLKMKKVKKSHELWNNARSKQLLGLHCGFSSNIFYDCAYQL
jgi:hypothetical protein